MINILHLVIDEKFIEGAISLFETDDRVENKYVCVRSLKNRTFKYLKNEKIQVMAKDVILDVINENDVLILHSLQSLPINLFGKISKKVKVVWLAWGYDLYDSFFKSIIPTQLYAPISASVYRKRKKEKTIKSRLGNLKNYIKYNFYLKKALARIDYFSGVFPYEFDEVCKYNKVFRAKPLDFYYGSLDFFIPENPSFDVTKGKKNVIIGNSGDLSNNHLDVIRLLKENNCQIDGTLIIPLSYGCDDEYANMVEQKANELCNGCVNALRKFIPLNDYLELVSNCRVAIYAHRRQQASDNIFLQLLYGAKVFMTEKSLAFHYLRKIGLHIYSLESDLNSFNEDISDEMILENRKILSALYSETTLIERIKRINETFLEMEG